MSSVINEAEIFSLNFCLAFVIENQDEDIMSTFSLSELLRTTQTCVNVMQRAVYQHSGRLHTPLDRIKMLTETASLQHKFLSRLCVDIENTHLATRIDRLIHFWEKAIETLRNSIISARSISNPITRTVLNHHLGIIDKMINSRPVFFRLMQENMRQALSLTFPEAVIQSKLYSSFKDNGYSYTAHISLQNISPDNPFQACKIACVELSMTLQKIVKVQNMFCSLLNTRYTDNKITKDPMEACLLFIRSSKYLRDNLKNTRNLLLQSVKQHDVEALYTRLKPFTLFRNQHRNLKITIIMKPIIPDFPQLPRITDTSPILLATYIQCLKYWSVTRTMPWEMAEKILHHTITFRKPQFFISLTCINSRALV